MWLTLAMGEAEARAGKAAPPTRVSSAAAADPNNRAVRADLCRGAVERNTPRPASARRPCCARCWAVRRGRRFPAGLRPRQRDRRRSDPCRRGLRRGRLPEWPPEQALVQLNTLKRRSDLDYYARARIESRIAAITPTVLELKRQGIRDEDLRRQ
jgi:hypothetical protein